MKIAAYHEAAHAVLAIRSQYHFIMGDISLEQYGAGKTAVTLSKNKLHKKGKVVSDKAVSDPDIAREAATIMLAGLEAEKQLHRLDSTYIPNPDCSIPDRNEAIEAFRSARLWCWWSLLTCRIKSKQLVVLHWNDIERVASFLDQNEIVDAVDILDLLNIEFV